MNFLITNSVPLNGGDEALLRATVEGLKRRFPGSTITTLCQDVEIARKYLPDLELDSDLEFVTLDSLERVGALYHDADIVLSAPGCFLHDFYSVEERLRGYEAALALNKPVVLLAQSIGPFWKPESLRRVPEVLNRLTRICVSDTLSKQRLLELGVRAEKIRETGEMAFLWRTLAPECFQEKTDPIRTMGLNFRVWPPRDLRAEKEILTKADKLCRFLLEENPEHRLLFLSTCQGVSNYVDDSELAVQIVEKLPEKFQARCEINRSHLEPRPFIHALSECDAFIGMRLHACILAMLGGTPAMGVGYESRTKETFEQLGLDSFQVPFESSGVKWVACAREFLGMAEGVRCRLDGLLGKACGRAELNLAVIHEEVRKLQNKKRGSDKPEAAARHLETVFLPAHESGMSALATLRAVQRTIPRGSPFILVDDTQWAGRFTERKPIPFLEKDGEYWGPPGDDAKAISELERLRDQGAEFIVFASPCFWWLNYYRDFHSYLQREYQHAFADEELIIFDLRTVFE